LIFDKIIRIEVQDPETEQWTDAFGKNLHANVNKTGGGTYQNAGADQYNASLTFKLRYTKKLEAIAYSPQSYRIIYRGRKFKVTDYDDYMEQHREVKLVGEFYE
jgi:SPP1 family predicted phage head-tail adaptor